MIDKIPHLEDLLQLDKTHKITSTKITNLTAPGENYGSLILKLDVEVQHGDQTLQLNLVAKTLPPNKEMQEMFNCPVTFRNEIGFYKTIFPTLRAFQREHGVQQPIDVSPKYYGSRSNLHGKNCDIDSNAVLLLENLKVKGFQNLERTLGFDLHTSKLVLADLAYLHATGLAFKLQKPDIFATTIKPYLTPLSLSKSVTDDFKMKYFKIITSVPQLEPYLERLKKANLDIYPPPSTREPFATISHNDCWVNNTMVRLEGGKAVENKLVDFQISDYGSPARDVLFFLFSSVRSEVLEECYDELLRFYYGTFTKVLEELKCDLEPFSFRAFERELDIEATNTQFAHVTLMLFPIFAPKMSVEDMAEVTPADIGNEEPTDLHKEKLIFVVEQFVKRNWI